ncbi:hypothetical protein L7F22_049132 [Adiantum nelumboides]|nr:hypothetical protein [Adiantum nelumboides]
MDAKRKHGVTSLVPIIIVEDETTIKRRIRWNAKDDTLIGFCGDKGEHHHCSSNDIIVVGDGSQGYDKIVDTFQNHVVGSYARLLIVNPLHESLPRLALMVQATCNRFDSIFIKNQRNLLESLWNAKLKDAIEPIIGHASDGDSRWHKLMLDDYLGKSHHQFFIDWCGWKLRGRMIDGHVYGLHDQDFVHGLDVAEIYFSKIGGMIGQERAFDFEDLLHSIGSLNKIAMHECNSDGLTFSRAHKKQEHIWKSLNKQEEGLEVDLDNYEPVSSDERIVGALKEGLQKAQNLYSAWSKLDADMGDADEYDDFQQSQSDDQQSQEGLDEDDEVIALSEIRHEIDVILDDTHESNFITKRQKINPTVEVDGKYIFQSTLVSQLNGNSTLSKDRLTRFNSLCTGQFSDSVFWFEVCYWFKFRTGYWLVFGFWLISVTGSDYWLAF